MESLRNTTRRSLPTDDVTSTAGTNTRDIPIFKGESIAFVGAGSTESVIISAAFHPGGNSDGGVTLIGEQEVPISSIAFVLMPLLDKRLPEGKVHISWYGCNASETLSATVGVFTG